MIIGDSSDPQFPLPAAGCRRVGISGKGRYKQKSWKAHGDPHAMTHSSSVWAVRQAPSERERHSWTVNKFTSSI